MKKEAAGTRDVCREQLNGRESKNRWMEEVTQAEWVLASVVMKSHIFWAASHCNLVDSNQISKEHNVSIFRTEE
jgi:hypothetical protein